MFAPVKHFVFGCACLFTIASVHVQEVYAVPIVFELGYSGTVSYGGGANPLTTTDGSVTGVNNGSTSLSISGGLLNFSTGNYLSGSSTLTGFQNTYADGGFLNIYGDIGGGSTLLVAGSFLGNSTFDCCSGSSILATSSFSSLLNISNVNSTLASALGFNLPATGGAIGQVQIFFGGSVPTTAGSSFVGVQGGGGLTLTDTASVPEPGTNTLIMLGVAMMMAYLYLEKQRVKNQTL